MCAAFKVSREAYYDWIKSTPSARAIENEKPSLKGKEVFIEGRCTYGARRIRKKLRQLGFSISPRRVRKLIKKQQLSCKTRRRFIMTTDSKHAAPIAENILARDFQASTSDIKYVGDITYIPTKQGWLYLAVVIDLYSRRVVGWALDNNMKATLVNDALLMAIWSRKPKAG
jgi:putative transposase